MSIKSIKIKNLLSFDELIIHDLKDINCIVGKNNTGKSNLLKLIRFFYNKLDNKRELPPTLNSNYSTYGLITITYDTSRINKIVTSETNRHKSKFFKYIFNVLFKLEDHTPSMFEIQEINKNSTFELTLTISADNSTKWSTSNEDVLNIINYLYPFFDIETRHINLYDWDKLWFIVSKLKSFNINNIKQDDIIDFFDERISNESKGYKDYISKIQNITKPDKYNYREKVLNYVRAGLKGQTFLIEDKTLEEQSDGTNSHRFIEIALELLISLSRRDYINPTIYIDEPEIGLHPKKNEELISKLYDVYSSYQNTTDEKIKGKYKTPYPKIIFATHSPNIVKEVIKLFDINQQILHFSKNIKDNTIVQKMHSTYDDDDKKFLNIFSDNEARLFFSNFILFVEGATEQEVFSNHKLINRIKNNKGRKFLQNIDVYATNELVLRCMNPSYSNTSIPYLVVYDADKLIKIDTASKKLIFLKTCINFITYLKIYKKSYIGSQQRLIYDFLLQLKNWGESYLLRFSSNKLYIENLNYPLLIKYLNDNFLLKENYFLNKTTIEEVLINKNNFYLLKKWLLKEFWKALQTSLNPKMPKSVIEKIKRKKFEELKNFKKYMNENFPEEKEKIAVFILLFGGKTETLIKIGSENYIFLNEDLRGKIATTREKFLSLDLKYLLGKTSGWVTLFLDFAIDHIENHLTQEDVKKRDKEFRDEFKKYFEELYDIITIIEKRLPPDR
jgi:predicted ATP-dependent endonuclease of OLD family